MGQVTIIPAPNPPRLTDDPHWHLSSDLECEITTLAALCELKRQQREPLVVAIPDDEDDESEGDEDDDLLTSFPTQLTPDGTKQTKMEFLDRLAEIVCREKHGSYVTCTSIMTEHEDDVTIVVSRNANWSNSDTKFFNELTRIMESIASREQSQADPIPALLALFTDYYDLRLRYHANQLLRRMERHAKDQNETADLTQYCQDFLFEKISTLDFVTYVQGFSRSKEFHFWRSWIKKTFSSSQSRNLLLELAFLRRPEFACDICFDAARDIPNFQRINIQLLKGFTSKKVQQTFLASGQFPMTPMLQKELQAKLDESKWVHAEMRMVTYLLSPDNTPRPFSYLGVSKKTCFLCGHIIQRLGPMFTTRANHGKVYSRWTMPSAVQIGAKHRERWEHAVKQLPEVLRSAAAREFLPRMDPAKESTMTTPVVPRLDSGNPFLMAEVDTRQREREAEWLSRFSKRGRASEPEKDTGTLSPPSSPKSDQILRDEAPDSQVQPADRSLKCSRCGAQSCHLVPCSKCRSVHYCDSDCRKAHWMQHKFSCVLGRPLDEADFLVQACQTGEPLINEDVCKAFGFLYFTSGTERFELEQLYRKLVNEGGVGDEELREAWRNNNLKEFILFRCAQLSPYLIGRERAWIARQDGFAANSTSGSEKIWESGRRFLDAEDRKLPLHQLLKHEEKRLAYLFYCQIFNDFVPDSDEDNWIYLGFCTARNQEETKNLGILYRALVQRCRFEEFWKAMADSTMVELFRKYDLGSNVTRLRNFKTVIQEVGKWYQSVWELKRFIRSSAHEPTRSVIADYGFMNCHNPQERLDLRQLYYEFFARGEDEMKLHQACIDGQLAQFLESIVGTLQVPHEVLSNRYPLEACAFMGMAARSVIVCPESLYEVVLKKQKADGGKEVVITIPDEQDEGARAFIQDRAAFTTGKVRVTQTECGGKSLFTMGVDYADSQGRI